LGCFRWTAGYYLLLVTRKRLVGSIHGCEVYGIDATALLPLSMPPAATSAAEERYRRLLSLVTFTKDFFFSYAWPLWCSVQEVLTAGPLLPGPFTSDRVWNAAASAPLRTALGHDTWVTPLIHGYWRQEQLSLLGRPLTLTLIARRSRQVTVHPIHRSCF
jgi:phosphatidylinositol 3,5-bisphosphate 5-phosphatase